MSHALSFQTEFPRKPAGAAVPLSFPQERLLFMERLQPNSPASILWCCLQVLGPLGQGELERALRLLTRHDALRTRFPMHEGGPAPVVDAVIDVPVHFETLEHLARPEREAAALARARAFAVRPFDLENGPLLRAALYRLAPETHVLELVVHHAVADAWSWGLLLKELMTELEATGSGFFGTREVAPLTYADYAHWQRVYLESKDYEHRLRNWVTRLETCPGVLELPTTLRRPRTLEYEGARFSLHVPRLTTKALKAIARGESVSLYTVLVAGFAVLLSRHTGEKDLIVGTPSAGRAHVALEPLVGMFVNLLPLRFALPEDQSFRDFLRSCRNTISEATADQDVPFEKIVEALQRPRDAQRLPLCQTLMVLQNAPFPSLQGQRLAWRVLETASGAGFFDVAFVLEDTEHGLRGLVEYNAKLFTSEDIQRLASHYRNILEAVADDIDRPLSEYSLASPELAHAFVDPGAPLASREPPPVSEQFFALATENPDRIAIRAPERELSYGQLAATVQRLAKHLVERGVTVGDVVSVVGSASVGAVTALLAVLSAGGVALLADGRLTPQRTEQLESRASAKLRLLIKSLAGEPMHASAAVPALVVDADTGAFAANAREPVQVTLPVLDGAAPAYVFFTSGSTGEPKGVLGRHGALAHFLDWEKREFAVGERDRVPLLTSLSFDVVLRDILLPLTAGAALAVPPSRDRLAALGTLRWLREAGVTILHVVPSLALTWLADDASRIGLTELRLAAFAGEPLTDTLVKRWREAVSSTAEVVNLYGPTETTLAKAFFRVSAEPAAGVQPIGGPISGTQLLVLDEKNRLCAPGEPGEIVIRTAHGTLGYLADVPASEHARFLPSPFSADGLLLYRTGDRGRYRADGMVEILGRLDRQLKIHGARVEPAEIEAKLAAHPGVQEAAVTAFEDQAGERQLAAYVVPRAERQRRWNGQERYVLPNNLAISQLNKNETDYLYREIFELEAYVREGLTIRPGDVVMDVGGNIGLFSIFATLLGGEITLHTFEPNPRTFAVLRQNLSIYAPSSRLHQQALSSSRGTATYTHFPAFSMLSGLHAEAALERETVKRYMENQLGGGQADMRALVEQADDILAERFRAESFETTTLTLSDVMRREGIERIDYLKINAEKSELDILSGIDTADWQKIDQIALEVDVDESVALITDLLARANFRFVVFQDPLLRNTTLRYIYAQRNGSARAQQRKASERSPRAPLPPPFLTSRELRQRLRAELPEYMVPVAWTFLDALPRTTSGKVARHALPAPSAGGSLRQASFVAPRTETERRLSAIWKDVLGIDECGITDGFFDRGGHSLMATRLASRIAQTFGVELPLATLFDRSTIAEQSAILDGYAREHELRAIPRRADTDTVPLSFAQERFWFLDTVATSPSFYNVPVAVRLTGTLDVEALSSVLDTVLHRHSVLRTAVFERDGEPSGVLQECARWPLQRFELTSVDSQGRERELTGILRQQLEEPFDLERAPLVRAALVCTGPDEHVLLVTMHHIATDGWSLNVLATELSLAYAGQKLPALPVEFADVAAWQRKQFETGHFKAALAYWKLALAAPRERLELPLDRARPSVKSGRGQRTSVILDASLVNDLEELAAEESATLFMVLMTCIQLWLGGKSGQSDVAVGSVFAGRNQPELEGLIGCLANTLVFRSNLGQPGTFRQLLREQRRYTLEAFANQHVPFEKVVEAVGATGSIEQSPLFQMLFVLQTAAPVQRTMGDLTLTRVDVDAGVVGFDLQLELLPVQSGLSGWLTCDLDLFEPSTGRRFASELVALCARVAANPDEPLCARGGENAARLADKPAERGRERSAKAAPPRTPVERVACQAFESVLEAPVGVHDHFFDLGGNSLHAVKVAAKISAALGRKLPVRWIFESPVVEELARRLSEPVAAEMHSKPSKAQARWPAHVSISPTSLAERFLSGDLAEVDALVIDGYEEGFSEIARSVFGESKNPYWFGVASTMWGRVGRVMLPICERDIYDDPERLHKLIREAQRFGGRIGAKCLALAGLIPSAIDYGAAFLGKPQPERVPRLTTGHATTIAAVTLNILALLERVGRKLADEQVCFVGLGSIGTGVLELLLSNGDSPAALTLVDVPGKQAHLRALAELLKRADFAGEISCLEARPRVPEAAYGASLFVGATNAPGVLDVSAVCPGALIVDDSAPHCFDVRMAQRRLEDAGDLLFTEGGTLTLPQPVAELIHVPPSARTDEPLLARRWSADASQMMGCTLSGLLSAKFPDLEPTLGNVRLEQSSRDFQQLVALGVTGSAPHVGAEPVARALIQRFVERFGQQAGK